MIWLQPLAAIALAGLAAPILIHLLAQTRAPRVPFPTLRFVQPFRLAAIRRRALDDLVLLIVRAAILAAAVGAIAGPLLVTPARRRAWDARVVRATIVERGATPTGSVPGTFEVDRAGDGLASALAWLDAQPPGRRAIVVRSAFPLGSVAPAEWSIVPRDVGLRFERTGTLPPTRTLPATPVLGLTDAQGSHAPIRIDREIILNGARTSVREVGATPADQPPIDIVAPADQPAADAVLRTVLADRVRAPHANHPLRIVLADAANPVTREGATEMTVAWMADTAAAVARDLAARGWIDTPIAFRASGDRLLAVANVRPIDPVTPQLVRSIVESVADPIEQPAQEIATISDEQLRQWSREPGPSAPPRREGIDVDDRRWLWGAALVLLALETWLRRTRPSQIAAAVDTSPQETSRVA